jgi:hypothetical protein
MTIEEYFSNTSGAGVLATADAEGRVDAAIYSTPHVMDDGSVAFIMRERLTHHNVMANPSATYLFLEDGLRHRCVRLFLRRLREEDDPDFIASLARLHVTPEQDRQKGPKHLVYFQVEKVLPLIGSGESPVTVK